MCVGLMYVRKYVYLCMNVVCYTSQYVQIDTMF